MHDVCLECPSSGLPATFPPGQGRRDTFDAVIYRHKQPSGNVAHQTWRCPARLSELRMRHQIAFPGNDVVQNLIE